MPSELESFFDDDKERLAYEAFLAGQERGAEGFALDAPALVCRWRMHDKHVPLLNRHIRALSQRRVSGAPLSHNMLSWAKQHVEWSLAEGSYAERDGVLMLVIDVNGNAAMTVGAYEPLSDTRMAALNARALTARIEARETGVAPELLGAVADGRLLMAAYPEEHVCGAATLVEQLASTRGIPVDRALDVECPACDEAGSLDAFREAISPQAAYFLVSDEHGIVPAQEHVSAAPEDAAIVDFLAVGIRKLFS